MRNRTTIFSHSGSYYCPGYEPMENKPISYLDAQNFSLIQLRVQDKQILCLKKTHIPTTCVHKIIHIMSEAEVLPRTLGKEALPIQFSRWS